MPIPADIFKAYDADHSDVLFRRAAPVIVMRFEGNDAKALARIQGEFRRAFNESPPGQSVPL